MFPYPSGKMHMGHVRNYLIGDVQARYFRMQGFDVLHPMAGMRWACPQRTQHQGQAPPGRAHRGQREAVQGRDEVGRLLLRLAARDQHLAPGVLPLESVVLPQDEGDGLVYRRMSRVNWCPGCATVIANEQVKDGTCERSGDPVVVKRMPEWAFRITRYSEELLRDLDKLTAWPDRVTSMQKNWIGKSEGTTIRSPSTAATRCSRSSRRVRTLSSA